MADKALYRDESGTKKAVYKMVGGVPKAVYIGDGNNAADCDCCASAPCDCTGSQPAAVITPAGGNAFCTTGGTTGFTSYTDNGAMCVFLWSATKGVSVTATHHKASGLTDVSIAVSKGCFGSVAGVSGATCTNGKFTLTVTGIVVNINGDTMDVVMG